MSWTDYFEGFLRKDRLATGRLINILESGEDPEVAQQIMKACAAQKRNTYAVGITGVPGAGKSTLIEHLGCWVLDQGGTLGVICVDPSSPFQGGAILGDRVRFRNLNRREGCFIRSMATRGHLGGLGTATRNVIQLLEAGGFDLVIIETVGTGQTEVEIVNTADTVVLVTVPALGDQMQVVKAGIMEIGDIFVVNQADRPGADDTVKRLRNDIAMFGGDREWTPPVHATVATQAEGIAELGESIIRRRDFLIANGRKEELWKKRKTEYWRRLLEEKFSRSLDGFIRENSVGKEVREKVENGVLDIYEATVEVWSEVLKECSHH